MAALDALLALFNGMKQAMRAQLAQDEAATAMAPMHLRLLQMCQQQPGITPQGLVQLSGRDKGQVARLMKDLEDAGLVQREAHPADRRSHQLRPTSAGLAACERFALAQAGVAALMFGGLSASERTALTGQLTSLKARLDERLREIGTTP